MDEGCQTNHLSSIEFTQPVGACNDDSMSHTPPAADRGLHVLGRGVKSLVQGIQKLRDLGVENLGLPLPKIVVVGDQSAGKSSLVEGISEIKMPRNAGTCTRCPLEINLVEQPGNHSPWTCKISLITKYHHDTDLIERATKNRSLGPWVLQDRAKKSHFATLNSKAQVEEALCRAQQAILKIGNDHEKYKMGLSLPKTKLEINFSPNIIQLDISGPELPNLSFYELPGVINISRLAHEEYLVALVKNLVKEYISTQDCINVLALPMTDDPANSSASQLIRDIKGARERTLGVITKPDRFQKVESLDQWDLTLSGEKFQLGFGYYVVKNNPNTKVSNSTARREEEAYFSKSEPWSTVLSKYEDRFGTAKLVTALSQKLTDHIRTSLPYIREQVEQKGSSIQEKLRQLPEPVDGNLPAMLYGKLMKLEFELTKHFDGGFQDCPFQREWHHISLEFREALKNLYPLVIVHTTQNPSRRAQVSTNAGGIPSTPMPIRHSTPISVDSDSDSDMPVRRGSTPKKRLSNKRPHPSTQSTPQKTARMSVIPTFRMDKPGRMCFDLDEIRGILQNYYVGQPGGTDPKATEHMIKLSMTHWEDPLFEYINTSGELCKTMIYERVLDVFGHLQNTPFYSKLTDICASFLANAIEDQREIAKQILGWELNKPRTLNEVAIEIAKENNVEYLKKRRRECLVKTYLDQKEEGTGKRTTGLARQNKIAQVTDAQLGPDPYSLEIKVMGSVRAYYECAFSRFVDNVYASLCGELFEKCRNCLVATVKQHFRATDAGADKRLASLVAANPQDELRRVQLMTEMETILRAQEHLELLGAE